MIVVGSNIFAVIKRVIMSTGDTHWNIRCDILNYNIKQITINDYNGCFEKAKNLRKCGGPSKASLKKTIFISNTNICKFVHMFYDW